MELKNSSKIFTGGTQIISVEAGSYKLKSAIEMPNNTTLRLDKEAYIECKSAVILIKIRKKNVLHIV